ncbi:MAG: thiamine phosphate synthase [Terrimicrobiaceae bacterium]|nr:thiamine phosphate synthase [Terrimicrobiaceae bacterium]
MNPKPIASARLYAILDLGCVAPEKAPEVAAGLLAGGAGALQLRAKQHDPALLAGLAASLSQLCRAAGVPFIVNDHPALARDCGADGLHLGQDDGPIAEARKVFSGLVGRSTHSPQQALAAQEEGADYIGFGPLFATPTKPDYAPIGLAAIASVQQRLRIPMFCIGGIHPGNLREVIQAGARRVVMVRALLQSPDPRASCAETLAAMEQLIREADASRS